MIVFNIIINPYIINKKKHQMCIENKRYQK